MTTLIGPDGAPAQKTIVPLTTDHLRMFTLFEDLLTSLGLQYWMRCRRCAEAGHNDAVWGHNAQTASRFVVECACTTREYRGAAVPSPSRSAGPVAH